MNPLTQLQADRIQARRLSDSNADVCFLALADSDGKASVRTLVLRDVTDTNITLFINKSSPKWQAIANGASCELLLWYSSIQRQYRISGSMQELNSEIVKNNWQRRPIGSKYLDYVYEQLGNQSSAIASRTILLDKIAQLKKTMEVDSMQAPSKVTGLELTVDRVEVLDLNSEQRIHDRQRYRLEGGHWESEVLIP